MNFLITIALLCLAPSTHTGTDYGDRTRTQADVHSCQNQYIICIAKKEKRDKSLNNDDALTLCVLEVNPK